jgi:hypothetical protein
MDTPPESPLPPPLPEESFEELLARPSEDFESRRTLLRAFIYARVHVLTDREVRPGTNDLYEARMTLVSDGPNSEQPMLAVFSSEERARAFQESTGGEPHRTEIDAVFALVCTPEKAGIIVNPNQTPNFRLAPELVAMLRERLEEARARTSGAPLPH